MHIIMQAIKTPVPFCVVEWTNECCLNLRHSISSVFRINFLCRRFFIVYSFLKKTCIFWKFWWHIRKNLLLFRYLNNLEEFVVVYFVEVCYWMLHEILVNVGLISGGRNRKSAFWKISGRILELGLLCTNIEEGIVSEFLGIFQRIVLRTPS